jgi:hypothetical protein
MGLQLLVDHGDAPLERLRTESSGFPGLLWFVLELGLLVVVIAVLALGVLSLLGLLPGTTTGDTTTRPGLDRFPVVWAWHGS